MHQPVIRRLFAALGALIGCIALAAPAQAQQQSFNFNQPFNDGQTTLTGSMTVNFSSQTVQSANFQSAGANVPYDLSLTLSNLVSFGPERNGCNNIVAQTYEIHFRNALGKDLWIDVLPGNPYLIPNGGFGNFTSINIGGSPLYRYIRSRSPSPMQFLCCRRECCRRDPSQTRDHGAHSR